MTLASRRLSHEALAARLSSDVTEGLGALFLGYAEEVDDVARPSIIAFRTEFVDPARPFSRLSVFDEGVSETVRRNRQLLNDMFNELLSSKKWKKGFSPIADGYLWAFSGVGFSRVDGTQVSGVPFTNTMMLVPSHLQAPLEAWVSRHSPSTETSSSGEQAWVTGFENLGSTEAAITRGSDHVLHFIRAWSPIADRDDINEKFLTVFSVLHMER